MDKKTHDHILQYLKKSRALGQLPDDLLLKLIPLCSQLDFSAGKTILEENSENNQVFILINGIVSVYSSGEFIVKLQRSGDIFGEMSVITGEVSSASVIAETEVELIGVRARDIGQYNLADAETLENIFFRLFSRVLAEKLALTTKKARQFEIANRQLLETQKELEKANREAIRAVQAKSAFLTMMSHEIRTPLNSIIGNTELLFYTDLASDQEKYLNTVHKSGELLLSIINNILDYSTLEAGELKIDHIPFDFKSLLEDLGEMFANAASRKDISLEIEVDGTTAARYIGDPIRIRQVLTNLFDNAIKFTAAGRVRLSLAKLGADEVGDHLQITVEDTGIGIPADKHVEIFDEFSQVDLSTTRKFGGTGLGLAICKSLVRAMGGEIGVDSGEDKGSTFWIRLRLPPAAENMPV
ncbi:cyclic nucleotide-binding domain-containing protein [bacterium]|nr:cyclic nucleotide-binding domain-containing protein [bacterium]